MSTRRQFLTSCGKLVTTASLGIVLLPLLEDCMPTSLPLMPVVAPPVTGSDGRVGVDISDLSDSNPYKVAPGLTGSDGMPILVTRVSSTNYQALSSYCPHQGCEVSTTGLQNGEIPCLCHGSLFTLDGSVTQGPAIRGLKVYDSVYVPASNQLRIKIS
jgi:Rieske Fe-S protein